MKKSPDAKLELTYKQFCAVLKKWDDYLRLEVKQMPLEFPSLNSRDAEQHGVPAGVDVPTSIEISELALALWQSLEAGDKEVDRIHDEFFVDAQVAHFISTFETVETIANNLDSREYWAPIHTPAEFFVKLGKPAQMILVRDGHLQKAIELFTQARTFKDEQEQIEQMLLEQREEASNKRAELLKTVRELDQSQCVFCGRVLRSHFKYCYMGDGSFIEVGARYFDFDAEEYEAREVWLTCSPCLAKFKNEKPEGTIELAYGRFSESEPKANE